jgi:hypothetical protein
MITTIAGLERSVRSSDGGIDDAAREVKKLL